MSFIRGAEKSGIFNVLEPFPLKVSIFKNMRNREGIINIVKNQARTEPTPARRPKFLIGINSLVSREKKPIPVVIDVKNVGVIFLTNDFFMLSYGEFPSILP